MKISKREQDAIKAMVEAGREFGFGNLINHLKSALAASLMEHHGFTEKEAQSAAGGGYLIAMHRDILVNAEWDETGKRYTPLRPQREGTR